MKTPPRSAMLHRWANITQNILAEIVVSSDRDSLEQHSFKLLFTASTGAVTGNNGRLQFSFIVGAENT